MALGAGESRESVRLSRRAIIRPSFFLASHMNVYQIAVTYGITQVVV